jgi:alpha-beta hydrolase superfamily lysophospholipase
LSEHRIGHFAGVGGLRIYRQSWTRSDSEARGAVVLAHGASEHSDRYRHVAARLGQAGFAVYALDHRGHGRSDGPRALIDRMDHAVTDLDALVVESAAAHPGRPLFLIGHSMGGTVALCYALAYGDRLAGLVLSGPLAALEAAPPPLRALSRVLSALAPRLPLIDIDAAHISRDPAVVEDYRRDPLVYHGRLPARTVAELARAIESFPERAGSITAPTLIMYGTEDRLCPVAGSVMLGERVGATDRTVIPYEGLYHEIFNEPEQARVLDDLCGWLEARAALST